MKVMIRESHDEKTMTGSELYNMWRTTEAAWAEAHPEWHEVELRERRAWERAASLLKRDQHRLNKKS